MWHSPALLLALLALSALSAHASKIKSDETVVFFPTMGLLDADGTRWTLPIHGWIFEPERDSVWRQGIIKEVQEHFEVVPASDEGRRCADRVSLFLVDNEGRKKLAVRIAGEVHELERSRGDGHFEGVLHLAAAAVYAHATGGRLTFEAVTADGDTRTFRGEILLPSRVGMGVISDLDDTIKVSDVLDRRELLRRTFLLPFEAVPGMAQAYAAWSQRGAAFHYVSSSPWQLYVPLSSFASAQGFPDGAYHLKSFRLMAGSMLSLFKSPMETKPPVIREILARDPERPFLLVGDSGEKDPEVYGLIARERPEQVGHIFIRRVEGADNSDARFAAAFANVPNTRWTVFQEPAGLSPAFADPTPR